MDKEKIKKLPKWVQNEFKWLENENKYYKKKMLELSGKNDTDIFMIELDKKIPLPKGSTIRFLGGNDFFDISIHEGTLTIYASNEILLIPRAANSCFIKINK